MGKEIDVAALRKKLGLSQPEFADKIGIGVAILRSWEQGRRHPAGPARALLAIIDRRPDMINVLAAAKV